MLGILVLLVFSSITGRPKSAEEVLLNLSINFVLSLGMALYIGFAAIHSVQRLDSPLDRTKWLIVILFFNIFGACIYLCTKYQQLRSSGLGSLIRLSPKTETAEQGRAANPHAFGTSGIPAAKQPRMPEASGDT